MYVTQSYMHPAQHPSGNLVSGVYRFKLDEEDVAVTNTLQDPNLFTTFTTQNPNCQYGADGIAFGPDGNLYVGNFGDGEVYRIVLDKDGNVTENASYAKDSNQLVSTDGMVFDQKGNLYIADFSANAIVRVTPDKKVECIAKSPDTDGFNGELDQP